eukprot:TRINITY_DN1017_c1_g2_i9.p1 TRINITY_DN1017_c1_g2~~TRINITY_DN1017_c1_g2_i9.p1  ORF type:complete len:295 (+),score=41.26 TRINITY_DN1017_c1_g2_i9:103-987(+)
MAAPGTLSVYARTMSGSLYSIPVHVTHRVSDLKESIQRIVGVAKNQQHLVLHGEELADDCVELCHLNLAAEDTVDISMTGKEMALVELKRLGITSPVDWQRHLWIALTEGDVHVLRLLIMAGVDINAVRRGCSTIHFAAESGHLSVVQILIEAGASVDARSKDTSTPLSIACLHGHEPVCEYLLQCGADPALVAQNRAPLTHAAGTGHVGISKLLLEKDVDINAQSPLDSATALIAAAEGGHLDAVVFLVEHGAQLNLRNVDRKTALHLASANRHVHVADYLISAKGRGCCLLQ